MTLMLLVAHFLALGVAVIIFLWIFFLHRRAKSFEKIAGQAPKQIFIEQTFPQRPASWLAIRSINPETVQAALDQHHFSISAPVNAGSSPLARICRLQVTTWMRVTFF